MAHIKCRYEKGYCGAAQRLNYFRKPCDPETGETDVCAGAEYSYDSWNNVVCECMYYALAEFEKTTKDYDISLGEYNPVLRIGKKHYSEILYLEIDGRVLIGGDQNA